MKPTIPSSLQHEHHELHTELESIIRKGGKIGAAAQTVATLLHPHFVNEEAYAMPPLGLLVPLTQGQLTPEMEAVITLADKLKAGLAEMLAEHVKIVAALKTLMAAAQVENQLQVARFAEKLMAHAKTEEEVLYPASILVGEYLKLRLEK